MIFSLNMVRNKANAPELVEELDAIREIADEALTETRNLASRLRPSVLDDLGLVPALRAYTDHYQQTYGVAVVFRAVELTRRLSTEVETALYRISQEALTNAAKYASAGKIEVSLEQTDGGIRLVVADDGRGFDVAGILLEKGTGIGLYSMKERAALVNGELLVRSEPGRGTTIEVEISTDNLETMPGKRSVTG